MNQYRALTPTAVAVYGDGVVELELSAADEANAIGSGLLELVTRRYRAVSHRYVEPQNKVFEATFVVDVEAALIQGGHIERVRKAPDQPPERVETPDQPLPKKMRK